MSVTKEITLWCGKDYCPQHSLFIPKVMPDTRPTITIQEISAAYK